jgi:hypothetical protein
LKRSLKKLKKGVVAVLGRMPMLKRLQKYREISCRREGLSCWAIFLVPVTAAILLAPLSLARFAYFANGGGSNNISAYKIGDDGALTPIPGSRFLPAIYLRAWQ